MVSYRKIFISLILVLSGVYFSYAQNSFRVKSDILWMEGTVVLKASDATGKETIYFTSATFDNKRDLLPIYFKRIKINTPGKVIVSFANAQYQTIAKQDLYKNSPFIKNRIIVKGEVTFEKKRPFAAISFIPIRKNPATGKYEKLVSFELVVNIIPQASQSRPGISPKWIANSVLANGNWYKISVKRDGIHKINYDFLKDIGMDVDEINPNDISIYGNGGGMLPELNSEFRYDDLQENAISVIDINGNNQFDEEDYILFYAQGPHQWYWDESDAVFYHKMNIYSEHTYYFITIDKGIGKRVTSQNSTTLPYTHHVTSFDGYSFHEYETTNFLSSGRKWYGEEFDIINDQQFNFKFANIVPSSTVYLKTSVAARSTTESKFTVRVGSQQYIQTLAPISIGYEHPYASENTNSITFTTSSENISVNLTYFKPLASSVGWLNYIELNARRKLTMAGNQLHFRDMTSTGPGNVSEFVVSNSSNIMSIWDVTDPTNVKSQETISSDDDLVFRLKTSSLKNFVAFSSSGYYTPEFDQKIDNQDLHGIGGFPEMLIVTSSKFINGANTLAAHHRNFDNLTVIVAIVDEIYNEFSSGARDICAIRDFVKMFYDRAGSDSAKMPLYLLLFGDGSYDYKDRVSGNTNYVPVFESNNSVAPVSSFTSDDFFGFLDDTEGGSVTGGNPSLDIAVGRLPVKTSKEANDLATKIIHYATDPVSLGSWKNMLCFVGDDEDNNTHINTSIGSEALTKTVKTLHPVYNIDKIYLDSYHQTSTPGGSRYPEVNDAIDHRILSGTFLMNYVGHGGGNGWAHERILEIDQIRTWNNYNKMPLFVTATCSFSAFDKTEKVSPGEHLILNPNGGAIAVVSTTRLVYSQSNFQMNNSLLKYLFKPVNGIIPSIGEIVRKAKNNTTSDINNRKFTFLGDPALTLTYPEYNVVTNKVNGNDITVVIDTLKALAKATIEGKVQDMSGNLLSGFNGIVYPTIYDKEYDVTTLKNDPGSKKATFQIRNSIIYKGKASVKSGKFTFTFIVPKDIAYKFGNGKISYYADNGSSDGNGYFDNIIIGGAADSFAMDNNGPELEIFMNDEKFAFGGMTDENPTLIVKLFDESGINTVGNGIGHDVTSVLDDDTRNTVVLNEFYEAELDNYQRGQISYPFSELSDGRHGIEVKAWDVYNNSAKTYTEFFVMSAAEFSLSHVLNYPNPFTTNTGFQFEHNHPGDILNISIQIYTVSGKIVKSISTQVVSNGYRVDNINWDGLDDYGDKIGKGVYLYRLTVSTY